jgi:hypothetical protein
MSEDALAGPLAAGGVALMAFSWQGYPRLQRLLGTKRLAQLGFLAAIPVALAIPTASVFIRDHHSLAQVSPPAAARPPHRPCTGEPPCRSETTTALHR